MNKKSSSELLINLLSLLLVVVLAAIFWEKAKFVLLFAVTLGLLVTIHEWGHFIAAKASGVRVYEFALGFGPRLVTYMRRNGTDYTIRLLPIGGFVNPKGMQPDDPITPDGLNGRRASERALVYLAGPVMNAILGVVILLFSGYLFGTADNSKVLVGSVERKSEAGRMQVVRVDGVPAARQAPGLQVGDRILEVNGFRVNSVDTVIGEINANAGKPVTVAVRRGSHDLVLTGVPEPDRRPFEGYPVVAEAPAGLPLRPGDQIVEVNGNQIPGSGVPPMELAAKLLGESVGKPVRIRIWRGDTDNRVVTGTGVPVKIEPRKVERVIGRLKFQPTPGQGPRVSLAHSLSRGWDHVQGTLVGLAMMFSKPKELGENVGGVVGIGAVLMDVEKLPAFYYFSVLASLSISLAVFNLLPIPVLDGGHLLVLTAEVLRRRRLEPETHRVVALVGVAIIGVLFVLITFKDIMKHFG